MMMIIKLYFSFSVCVFGCALMHVQHLQKTSCISFDGKSIINLTDSRYIENCPEYSLNIGSLLGIKGTSKDCIHLSTKQVLFAYF